MGLLSRLRLVDEAPAKLEAQYAPAVMDLPFTNNYWNTTGLNYGGGIDRVSAMQIPSVTRCRNLLSGVLAALPLELYNEKTGAELDAPVWLNQPDIRQPRAVTIAWTIDSLLFYGCAYWFVTEVEASTGRPSRFEWVQNTRVSPTLDATGHEVLYYTLNGKKLPMSGVGSLITFQGLTQGILSTGARTLQAALDLEKAASVAASTPMPSGYISNSGADLPEGQVQGLLAAWKSARNSRSTAFLTSTLSFTPTNFSPKEMLYVEGIQNSALQVARLCNIPAFYLSAEVQGNSMTYQNIIDGRRDLVALSLQPFISCVESRLSMDDLTPRGNCVKMAVDETFLRSDALTRLNVIEKMINLNLITVEQAQAMEQLTPMGIGDGYETNIL